MRRILIAFLLLQSCAPKETDEEKLNRILKEAKINVDQKKPKEGHQTIHHKSTEDSLKEVKRYFRLSKIMDKYNCDIDQAESIENHKVTIGMTKKMCVGAWGRPDDINRTVAENYVNEQWVYGYTYLYFNTEGILYSYQD